MMRAVKTFRVIGSVRFLIRLIIEVLIDFIPFLTIVISVIVAFSVVTLSVFISMDTTGKDKEDFEFTKKPFIEITGFSYQMAYGENPTEDYKYEMAFLPLWLIYLGYTIFMCIVMLNLLVSIIGDTYERV